LGFFCAFVIRAGKIIYIYLYFAYILLPPALSSFKHIVSFLFFAFVAIATDFPKRRFFYKVYT